MLKILEFSLKMSGCRGPTFICSPYGELECKCVEEREGGASEVAVAVASQYCGADERVGHSWSASECESV